MSLFYDSHNRKPSILAYIFMGITPFIVIAAFWYYGKSKAAKVHVNTQQEEPDIFKKK